MPSKYAALAPQLVELEDGTHAWSFEGGAHLHLFGLENVGGKDPADLNWRVNYNELPTAYYQPQARLEAMDVDGIDAALFFPSVAGHCSVIHDDTLYEESLKAYNDMAWDWCQQGDPARMLPTALIPVLGLQPAMKELERVAQKGFRHFQFFISPTGDPFPTPADDPFWALAAESGLVVSMHGGGRGRVKMSAEAVEKARKTPVVPKPPDSQIPIAAGRAAGLGAPQSLALMIGTGVLERHPTLKVALIETSAGWLPSMLERMDAEHTRHRWLHEMRLKLMPSEYFERQVKISIDREIAGVKYRHQIGVDHLMFGTDFPHIGAYYPHTRHFIDVAFDAVPEGERQAILWDNAAQLFEVN